jgi:hypothetical protein
MSHLDHITPRQRKALAEYEERIRGGDKKAKRKIRVVPLRHPVPGREPAVRRPPSRPSSPGYPPA